MAYGVTTDGFVIKPFAVIRAEIESYQRTNIDTGLTLIDRSNLGGQNISVINQIAELWELGQAVYSSHYPDSANGWNLDQAVSLTGTRRSLSTKTLVTGQVTLNPDKNLPAGSVANLTSQPNVRFVTLTEVPADPAGQTTSVVFEAEIAGATQVTSGQLSEIAEPVSGWTAVTNAVAGATGDQREEDDELRIKRENELTSVGSTNTDAIRAGLLTLDGVVDARVTENVLGVVSGGLKRHSIYAIVRGGTSSEIGQKIYDKKSAGTGTNGLISNTITDSQGTDHVIYHDLATELVFKAAITVTTLDTYDAVQGPIDIKAGIAAYVNGLGIGDDVLYDEIKVAAYAVTGVYQVTALTIWFGADTPGVIDLPVSDTEFASSDVANITVT
jgi:uncharacterized phage protein gp47/JayE